MKHSIITKEEFIKGNKLTSKLNFLSDVLEDFCNKNDLMFASADDILYTDTSLTTYQKDWLRLYIETWDIIEQNY